MSTPNPIRRPPTRKLQVVDYADVAAFFRARHRLPDEDVAAFWAYTTPAAALRDGYTVVDVADVLMNGPEGAARFAGLLQKEYKDPVIVLDLRSRRLAGAV